MYFLELWTIVDEFDDPILPVDGNDHEDQGMLVYRSKDAAKSAAKYQNGLYDLNCKPKRIFTASKEY